MIPFNCSGRLKSHFYGSDPLWVKRGWYKEIQNLSPNAMYPPAALPGINEPKAEIKNAKKKCFTFGKRTQEKSIFCVLIVLWFRAVEGGQRRSIEVLEINSSVYISNEAESKSGKLCV